MPFSRIPGEAFDEVSLKDLEESGFGEHIKVSDHFEGGSVLFLGKHSNQVIALD
jgi:hypothetical protein